MREPISLSTAFPNYRNTFTITGPGPIRAGERKHLVRTADAALGRRAGAAVVVPAFRAHPMLATLHAVASALRLEGESCAVRSN